MVSRLLKVCAVGISVLFNFQCANPPSVSKGASRLGVVQFPKHFSRTDSDGGEKIITTIEYEVRQPADSPVNKLLFGMKDWRVELRKEVYSENFYAVSLDGYFQVRPASEQEWNQSRKLPSVQGKEIPLVPITNAEDGVQYHGKEYGTGASESWTRAMKFPSPNGRWLAVFGDTSKESKRPGIPGFSGRGRTKGTMFVDVYDTISGEKILAGYAPHRGGAYPDQLFINAIWLEDRYLVVPLDANAWHGAFLGSPSESCFLAILPEN